MAGIKTPDLPLASSVDELLGNNASSTVRIPTANLSDQLGIAIINVRLFGAIGDGVADDKAAFEAAMASISATGGVVLFDSNKKYLLSDLNIPAGITLRGGYELPDNNGGVNQVISYGSMGALLLNSTGTITLNGNSWITNALIYRNGMTFPAPNNGAFAGTAIMFTADGAGVRNCLIMGFNTAITQTYRAAGIGRLHMERIGIDCNNGIIINTPAFDRNTFDYIRMWPFSTANSVDPNVLIRPGYGLSVTGQADDMRINDVFTFGYKYGFNFQGFNGASCGILRTEYPTTLAAGSGSRGITIGTNVDNFRCDQVYIYGHENSIVQLGTPTDNFSIGYLAIDTAAGSAVSSTAGDMNIDYFDIKNITSYAFNMAASSRLFATGRFLNIGLGYVALPFGATTNNIVVTPIVSDGVPGSTLHSINTISPASIASAATLALPMVGDCFNVTGTAAITTISGVSGQREITLTFASAGVVINTADNVSLETKTYTSIANSYLRLRYDAATAKWREISRTSLGNATTPTVTSNYVVLETDRSVTANGTASITLTLPTASNYSGRRLAVKTIAAFTVVSASSNVVPQLGGAAGTAILPATAGSWAELESDGTNWKIIAEGFSNNSITGTYAKQTITQVFTASGTYTPTPGMKIATVYAFGAGGAGGSGARNAAGNATGGGSGGGGGGLAQAWFSAAQIGASQAVTIGAHGVGGAAQTTNGTAGISGTAGGATALGSILVAGGGGGGQGGALAANSGGGGAGSTFGSGTSGAGGIGGSGSSGQGNGGSGVGGGTSAGIVGAGAGGAGSPAAGTAGLFGGYSVPLFGGGTGGGSGGGITAANVASDGGAGLLFYNGGLVTFAGGAAAGAKNGTDGGTYPNSGGPLNQAPSGAGGGASELAAAAGNGGVGGLGGGGGGGGGASRDGNNSGAGGNGGEGLMIIVEQF